jgi:hypothetical protein
MEESASELFQVKENSHDNSQNLKDDDPTKISKRETKKL